jgi:DNA repair protein RecO (recombination protein O)
LRVPTLHDNAICIRRWDYSETSQTVSLLTRRHGMIRGIAKGAKREKGSFSGGIDLLALGEIVAIVKPGRDLATLTQWHHGRSFVVLRESLPANRSAWFMADLVHHMITDHDPHPAVFDGLIHGLDTLTPATSALVLLRFQMLLLHECGYAPQLDRDTETGGPLDEDESTVAFSPSAGGVVADTGTNDRWRVRTETLRLLRAVAAGEEVEPDPATLDRANQLLAWYFRELIGSEPRSWSWLFG